MIITKIEYSPQTVDWAEKEKHKKISSFNDGVQQSGVDDRLKI